MSFFGGLAPPLSVATAAAPTITAAPSVPFSSNNVGSTPVAVTLAATPTAGDILTFTAYAATPSSAGAFTFPAGFSTTVSGGTTTTGIFAIATKTAGASEPTSYSVSWSGGAGDIIDAIVVVVRSASSIDGTITGASGLSDTMTAPSVSAAISLELLLCWFFHRSGFPITDPPTGMSLVNGLHATGTGSGETLYCFSESVPAGSTGSRSCQTHPPSVNYWFAYSELLTP